MDIALSLYRAYTNDYVIDFIKKKKVFGSPLLESRDGILKTFIEVITLLYFGVVNVYSSGFTSALMGTTNTITQPYSLPARRYLFVIIIIIFINGFKPFRQLGMYESQSLYVFEFTVSIRPKLLHLVEANRHG